MIVEVVTFRLAPGADEAAFLEADERVQQEFVPHRPGFVRRTTARGSDGQWLVLVLWQSNDQADTAHVVAESDSIIGHFMSLLDADSLKVARFESLG